MLKTVALAASILSLFAGSASARTWYVAKGGNQCVTVPFSPQHVIDVYAQEGVFLHSSSVDGKDAGIIVTLTNDGGSTGFAFFTNERTCQSFVAALIADGDAADPDDLK